MSLRMLCWLIRYRALTRLIRVYSFLHGCMFLEYMIYIDSFGTHDLELLHILIALSKNDLECILHYLIRKNQVLNVSFLCTYGMCTGRTTFDCEF